MNFGMIFLCLLIGSVIGFEVGKYTASKKIVEMLNNFADKLKEEAEATKREQEENKKKFDEAFNSFIAGMKEHRAKKDISKDEETCEDGEGV